MSILWNFDKYAKIEELPFDPASINENDLIPISDHELLLKAGTPLVESSGVVAPLGEDDDPTCFAAEDYHFILTNAQQPNLVKCVTKGYIEKAKVLEAMSAEEDPTADWAEDLAALGLYLVDDLGALPGGSGGESSDSLFHVFIAVDDTDPNNPIFSTKKCTFGEIKEAADSGSFVYASCWTEKSELTIAPLNRITTIGEGGGMLAFCNSFGFDVSLYALSDDDIPTSVEPTPPAPDIGGGVG